LAFTNLSTHATAFAWTFGDGGGSAQRHPRHAYAAPGTYTATLTATNACDSAVYRHPVTVESYDLALTTSAPQQVGDPGQVLTFTARLTNTGTLSDTFDLALLDHDWAAQIITDAVFLDVGASAPVSLTVTVPVSAEGGDSDPFTLRARASSDPRSSPATADLALEAVASTLYGVFLTADLDSQTVAPGTTATYTLEVVNASNVVATVALTRTDVGWPTTLTPASLDVAPAGLREVEVAVTVPADTPLDAVDVATIRATVQDAHQDVVLTTRAGFATYLPLVVRE
jgi:PKD repeat protein